MSPAVELDVEITPGQRELFRACIRADSIDLVASNELWPDIPPDVAWPMLLADIFHHAVDGAVEQAGRARVLTVAELRDALTAIQRQPHVGQVTSVDAAEVLPPPGVAAFEVVRARRLPGGDLEMMLAGAWWDADLFPQWAQLLFDLVHAAAKLAAIAPSALMEKVLEQVDRPTTTFQGTRSRVSNILPRGEHAHWVSIPREDGATQLMVRLDLSLVLRAPLDWLGVVLEAAVPYDADERGFFASEEERERVDLLSAAAREGLKPEEVVFAARTQRDGVATLLFYVANAQVAARVGQTFTSSSANGTVTHEADPSWSRLLALRPDRDELRRLANWEWLEGLEEEGYDIEQPAVVTHAFWCADAKARDHFAQGLSRAGLVVVGASEDAAPGRWECLVEQELDSLIDDIDEVTTDLDALALEAGALYDGWSLARSRDGQS
jgi:hypothetical protein